jgi:glycosyltransferase involved in cell wall biosynthesis
MVNQWQLLSLIKRNDIALNIRDAPFYEEHWSPVRGLFSVEQEEALASLPAQASDDAFNSIYKISFPYDFSAPSAHRNFVFGTAEYRRLDESYFGSLDDIRNLAESDRFFVITPSHWSRDAFLHLGLRSEQVIVIPHGVDPNVFFKIPEEERNAIRERIRVPGFVFANASSMTGNKGIDLLLRAFAVVAEKRGDCRLLLKGTDQLYQSKGFLGQAIAKLPSKLQTVVLDRLIYIGGTLPNEKMAEFYQIADVYVSPYHAEGFNLPVLEASACGTPVICTNGGPTDDFVENDFAYRINSVLKPVNRTKNGGFWLEPDVDHLVHLMLKVMDDVEWRKQAAAAGERHAAMNFCWDSIVDRLLGTMFASDAS